MAFNGSGTYVLPGAALVDGQTISATEHNTLRNDMATALTTCVTRDGQSPATANIPMGGFKHTGLAAGTGNGESVRYEQVTSALAATGGSINGVTIGATSPSTVKATTIETTGTVGIGTAPLTYQGIRITQTLTGNATGNGVVSNPTGDSGTTNVVQSYTANPATSAATYACTNVIGYRAVGFTKGSGSTVTNYYALLADAETDATNNFGVSVADNSGFGDVPSTDTKLRVKGVDSTSSNYATFMQNSAASTLFYVRNDGAFLTGAAASSPYNSTTAAAANVSVNTTGLLQRSTSSIRFKTGVEDMQQQYAEALVYQSRPVFYRSTCEADNPLHSYWGFIAEELAEIDPRVVQWGKPLHTVVKDVPRERFVRDADGNKVMDEEGNPVTETYIERVEVQETDEASPLIPDGVAYERFVVALVKVAQDQRARIDALEARLTAAGL